MSQVDQLAATVLFYFQQLRNHDTVAIAKATDWLQNFYQQRESLIVLTTIMRTCANDSIRMQGAIGLKHSIGINWENYVIPEQDSIFQLLLNIVMNETSEIARSNIIVLMYKLMSNRFLPHVLSILQSNASNPDSIITLLDISELLCHAKVEENTVTNEFMYALLQQAFQRPDIQINLAAFRIMICALRYKRIPSIEFFWPQLLSLFDICAPDIEALKKLTQLFISLIDDFKLFVDCNSLTQKLLPVFYTPDIEYNYIIPIFTVIEALCNQFLDYFIVNNLFVQVMHISFHLIFKYFDPNDLSKTQFFESAISTIVQIDSPRIVLSLLWQICCQVVSIDAGKFAAISALKAVAEQSRDFFDDKVKQVSELILVCLSSNCIAIQVTAASALIDFQSIFQRAYDPLLMIVARQILELIQHNPTREYLEPFAALLKSIPDTTEIFDEVINTLLQLIHAPAILPEADTILSLSALVAHSPEKVSQFIPPIIQVIQNVLMTTNEAYLPIKPSAVNLLEELLRTHYEQLVEDSRELFLFLSRSLHNEDSDFMISALQVLNTIFEKYPNAAVEWSTVDLQYLMELSEQDWSSQFKLCIESHVEYLEDTVPFHDKFKSSVLALRILSLSCNMSEMLCQTYANQVLNIASMQTQGVSEACIADACGSISIVARALYNFNILTQETTENIVEVLVQLIRSPEYDDSAPAAFNALKVLLIDLKQTTTQFPDLLRHLLRAVADGSIPSAVELFECFLILEHNPQVCFECVSFLMTVCGQQTLHPCFAFSLVEVLLHTPNAFDRSSNESILAKIMEKAQDSNSQFFTLCLLSKCVSEDPAPIAQRMFEVIFEAFNPEGNVRENSPTEFLFKSYPNDPNAIAAIAQNGFQAILQQQQQTQTQNNGFAEEGLRAFIEIVGGNEQVVRIAFDLTLSAQNFPNDARMLKILLRGLINEKSEAVLRFLFGEAFQDFCKFLNR